MNRLSSSVMPENLTSTISDANVADDFLHDNLGQHNTSESRSSATEPANICSVFTPLHYEPNYAYPLVVWLHAEGENETQLRQVMPKISMRNYAAVAPRGTVSLGMPRLDQWGATYSWPLSNGDLSEASEHICMAMEHAEQRFSIDSNRIFLAGSGAGGTMALQIGMTLPERFAGIVSVGGPLPREDALMAHLNEIRQMPILLMVERDNEYYPNTMVCEDLRLLHIAGMTVTLRQYPAGGTLRDSMLSDIDPWIMDVLASGQKTPIVTA